MLTNAFYNMICIDISIFWQFCKGTLTKQQLFKYKDVPYSQIPAIIKNKDKLDLKSWSEYEQTMEKIYAVPKCKISHNWQPQYFEYFDCHAERPYKSNQKIEQIHDILPAKVTTYTELLYWQDEILQIAKNRRRALYRFKDAGVHNVKIVQAKTLGHLRDFSSI